MNKRELIVRDLLMERFKAGEPTYAIPDKIIVKENKKKDGFIVTEIWDTTKSNKPFWVLANKDLSGGFSG